MTPVWKEVLCCGWQIDPRSKKRYEIKPEHVKEAHRNFQKMRSRGIPVPACWEHQDIEAGDAPEDADAIAEWKRRYSRYTFAHLSDSRINDRGNLDMLHDVDDPDDVKRLKKVKYVSPKIYNGYSDSRGGEYDGVTVVHSAATPSPVQHWQRPFSIGLSEDEVLYFEYAPPSGDDSCPVYSETFSEWLDRIDAVILSATEDETVADEEKTEKKDFGGKGGEGGNADLKAIVKALKEKFGAKISDKVSNWSELLIAIESNAGEAPMDEEPMEPNPDEDTTAAADAATTGGAPMVMSTLDRDPKKRSKAEREAKPERDDAAKRVDALLKTGRIDAVKSRALLRRVSQVDMSFTATGEAGGKRWLAALAEIAELEKAKPNSAWQATGAGKPNRSAIDLSTTEADRPKEVGLMSKERSAEVTSFILGEIPIQAS